jgi:hypothetical protein
MSVKRLVPLRNYYSSTVPTRAADGDMYLDTTTGRIKVYHSGTWKALAYLEDVGIATSSYDGGYYNTSVFDNTLDNMYYNTSSFDVIIDAGRLA